MRQSEETYYGTDDPAEIKMTMAAERRPQKGVAEAYFESRVEATTITGKEAINICLSAKHVLVIGGTGSGKTFFVTRACEYLDMFVFVNTQEEVEVENVCQVVTSTPEDLLEIIGEGYTKIEFIPSEDEEEAMIQMAEIREILFNLGGGLYPKKPPEDPTMNYIMDEAQLYAPKMSHTDLDNIGTRGRRWGVRGWFLTQRPQLLSSTLINMCEQQVIFRTGQYESKYFSGYKIPIDGQFTCLNCGYAVMRTKRPSGKCPRCGVDDWSFTDFDAWLDKKYHFLLWDGHTMKQCYPVME